VIVENSVIAENDVAYDNEGEELKEASCAGHPLFYQFTEEEVKLHDEKNRDYRSDDDPLANFKRVAAWMALYPKMNWATLEGVALVYAMKQQDAALSLLERGYEGGVENIDTRAIDVSVYWKLLRILHRESKKK
jgi:hypothetical protein